MSLYSSNPLSVKEMSIYTFFNPRNVYSVFHALQCFWCSQPHDLSDLHLDLRDQFCLGNG